MVGQPANPNQPWRPYGMVGQLRNPCAAFFRPTVRGGVVGICAPGTALQLGSAVLEVSDEPHHGCGSSLAASG